MTLFTNLAPWASIILNLGIPIIAKPGPPGKTSVRFGYTLSPRSLV